MHVSGFDVMEAKNVESGPWMEAMEVALFVSRRLCG